jgi:chromosome segregation ATPase
VERPERRREILDEALGHVERQLELIRHRRAELGRLEDELAAKRRQLRSRRGELDDLAAAAPS